MTVEQGGDMRALVEVMARALVDDAGQLSVNEAAGEGGAMLELRVAAGDLGKVIGRQGRTARSMRNILSAACMKLQKRYSLEIIE